MATNPISATEIKSRWRQEFSPSITNNGPSLGLFMKTTRPPKTYGIALLKLPKSSRCIVGITAPPRKHTAVRAPGPCSAPMKLLIARQRRAER